MTSQIPKIVDSLKTKIQKPSEWSIVFLQLKKIYINGYGVAKDFVTAEVTFKVEKHIKYAWNFQISQTHGNVNY